MIENTVTLLFLAESYSRNTQCNRKAIQEQYLPGKRLYLRPIGLENSELSSQLLMWQTLQHVCEHTHRYLEAQNITDSSPDKGSKHMQHITVWDTPNTHENKHAVREVLQECVNSQVSQISRMCKISQILNNNKCHRK